MGIGVMLFLEACVIENQGKCKVYEITRCGECGYDVQLEQSNGICWHCHPLCDPPKGRSTTHEPNKEDSAREL